MDEEGVNSGTFGPQRSSSATINASIFSPVSITSHNLPAALDDLEKLWNETIRGITTQ